MKIAVLNCGNLQKSSFGMTMENGRIDDNKHFLYWRDQLVGIVTDVGWQDFPWAGGKIVLADLSDHIREVLEYIDVESKTDDGIRDWPFPDEMAEHWRIVKPNGKEVEIMCPVVDFAEGVVTWR